MSGLSNRSLHGGASSASMSSAPRTTGCVSPLSPSSAAATTREGILQNHSKHNHQHGNNNPVTKVASKLNELVTQGLFGCGSPRSQSELVLLEDGEAVALPTDRQRYKEDHTNNINDLDDDDGIEIDTENSLRPSYELYRV